MDLLLHHQLLLDQVRLEHVFNRAPFLADRRSQAFDSDRAPVELLDDRPEKSPVHGIEAARIDLQYIHGPLRDGTGHNAVSLDLLEAADKHKALKPLVIAHEQSSKKAGALGSYEVCLDGGNANAGRKVFHDFEATRCTRCHKINNNGGNAGPALNGVGKRLTPEQLLAALITPSASIAEGFSTTTVELTDASVVAGVITKDQDGEITIVDINGKEARIPLSKIRSRSANKASAMPAMGESLSKRQLRDLIAFLKKQKK